MCCFAISLKSKTSQGTARNVVFGDEVQTHPPNSCCMNKPRSNYCLIRRARFCKSKMWLIPTLSVVPNYIPSNIKEDNLRVQTFRVLYASGTAVPHTSPVGICVSWRPTQRPCDVIWMMCYHLSFLLDNPCCSKRWHGIRILKCHVTEVTVTSMLTLLWHLSVSHDVTGWQHLYWRH